MDQERVVDRVLEEVAEAAPHITSGMLHRREYVGEENPSEERVREADVWANELLKEKITEIEGVGQFASEEEEEVTECGSGLAVAIDPLDGSSNIPTNNLVGTIVGIYDGELPCRGRKLVAAFYVLYGPLTTFTVARNGQVDEYVLEEKPGDKVELYKASEDIEVSEPYVYGFGGNKNWTDVFREFEASISREYKLRYGGALVGDFNQMLHHGGIFAYPYRTDAPEGKYRLIFEGNPMAYIIENAEGASSNGEKSILDVKAEEIHQRVPFFAGHPDLIDRVEKELQRDR
ncbi:MAG: class 1 fructose-bisphosphatase [Candidatus Nanohaloarchaea archaeon]